MIWRWEVIKDWLDNPKIGAEIGVKEGRFTAYLLKHFSELRMYNIDPWEEQEGANEDYKGWDFISIYQDYKNNINPYRNRIIEMREYSETACQRIEDQSLDFIFIDAQHDYESVNLDIELWKPKVKIGGLLAGHDYAPKFPGVMKAVNERFNKVLIGENDVWGIWL